MWIHTAMRESLISANTAMEIARLVTLDRFGQKEVDRNMPMTVRADEDTWIISGASANGVNENNPPDPSWPGPLRMVISSLDGQILSYTFTGGLPWLRNPGIAESQ